MNELRAIISVASGRRAKRAVLVFWPVMPGISGSLSAS
jgi:hypothetical protein